MKAVNFFKIINFGCKLNSYEAESIHLLLKNKGLSAVERLEEADLIVINTCTVTSKADSKCRNAIRKIKRLNPGCLLIVCGCLVNTDHQTLKELPQVDLMVKNSDKDKIAFIIDRIEARSLSLPSLFETEEDGTFNFRTNQMGSHSRALLKIQDGCDHYCSYCKIPFARGKSRSRSIDEIISEIREISRQNYREIILTGINISSYQYKGISFSKLLSLILKEFATTRFRLSSLEPQDIDGHFYEAVQPPNLCPHFHIALQNGSDSVLKNMNRHYTAAQYIEMIQQLRTVKKDFFLATDLIIGFPGESEADFEITKEIIQLLEFSHIHLFGFSPRKGTKAFSMLPKIPERIRDQRISQLNQIVKNLNYQYRKKFLHKPLQVLIEKIEKIEKRKNQIYTGKSENYIDVQLTSHKELSTRQVYPVLITEVNRDSTRGKVLPG